MKRINITLHFCTVALLVFSAAVSADEKQSEADVTEQSVFRPIVATEPVSPFAVDEKSRPVKVNIFPMYSKLPRGGKCMIAVELEIKDGWHINANPSNPDFLVPTTLEVKTKQKVKLTKVKYPSSHKLNVKGSPDPYHVYDGKVIVYGLLEIDAGETAENVVLEFHVNFQGCNEDQCLPPDKIVMGVKDGKLKFAAKGEEPKLINENKFPKPKPQTAQ